MDEEDKELEKEKGKELVQEDSQVDEKKEPEKEPAKELEKEPADSQSAVQENENLRPNPFRILDTKPYVPPTVDSVSNPDDSVINLDSDESR